MHDHLRRVAEIKPSAARSRDRAWPRELHVTVSHDDRGHSLIAGSFVRWIVPWLGQRCVLAPQWRVPAGLPIR